MEKLAADALAIRRRLVKMHYVQQSGHLGSGLSCVDILTYLYGSYLRPQDHFILSKGHAASALYATLAHYGKMSEETIAQYLQDGSTLPAHPAPLAHPEIQVATGSLGHGLPIAVGMAYAFKKIHKTHARVVVLLSDGECQEGSTWEAALFAGHHELSNLTVIVDYNGLQGFGKTSEVLGLGPITKKWENFGFSAISCYGHRLESIHSRVSLSHDMPKCVVAMTHKGAGLSFMEDRLDSHYLPLTAEQYEKAQVELAG